LTENQRWDSFGREGTQLVGSVIGSICSACWWDGHILELSNKEWSVRLSIRLLCFGSTSEKQSMTTDVCRCWEIRYADHRLLLSWKHRDRCPFSR
jgi:hypothetical protein